MFVNFRPYSRKDPKNSERTFLIELGDTKPKGIPRNAIAPMKPRASRPALTPRRVKVKVRVLRLQR